MGRRTTHAIAALLLAAYFVLALGASRSRGPAFDETAHIAAGYNAWRNHDFRFDPGNGDFPKRWATFPLLFTRPNFPSLTDPAWRKAEFFDVGYDVLFHAGNDAGAILLQCRAMIALLGVALGAGVFFLARSLFGNPGALVSLALYALSPNFLAYGATVSTEISVSLALIASTWLIWRLLHAVTLPLLIGSLLAVSVLLLSKLTAVLILPIAAVLIAVRFGLREPPGPKPLVVAGLLSLHVAVGWGAIWAAYDFRYLARRDPSDSGLVMAQPGAGDSTLDRPVAAVLQMVRAHHWLPEGYLEGIEGMVRSGERRPAFLDGHWKAGGWKSFFAYAFWAKTPPAVFPLLALGLLGIGRRRLWSEAAPFFVLVAIYAAAALASNVDIGHRHLLPIYPALYVLAGGAAIAWPARRVSLTLATVLVGCFAADSLSVWPHCFSYFSPAVGGPAMGYRRLVDSSLDWGQDLPSLRHAIDALGGNRAGPVYFSYFGTGDPDYYGVKVRRLPGYPDWRDKEAFAYEPGIYAISATLFQNLYTPDFGPWNRIYEREYQASLATLGLNEAGAGNTATLCAALQKLPESRWQAAYGRYESLRFNRLCAWLRATGRRPDATAGDSILVWSLDEAELHQALWGKPVELFDRPASWVREGL